MKKTFLLLGLTISNTCFAVCQGQFQVTCPQGVIDRVDVTGQAHLSQSTVTGPTNVNGQLLVNHSILHQTSASGKTVIDHASLVGETTLYGQAKLAYTDIQSHFTLNGDGILSHVQAEQPILLSGTLIARQSTLPKGVIGISNYLKLEQTQAGPINIKPHPHDWTTPKVYLLNHSHVKGDIRFIGHPGLVYQDTSSSLSGRVINGQLLQR